MSSMRNVVQRRSHRERAQPAERKRLGLLEKHKDYRLRAQDWNKKKAVLANLRRKAADRNEDEFSYKMLSRARGPGSALTRGSDEKRDRHWTGTVDGARAGSKSLSVDTVRLLKTQDAGYIRTMRNVAAKEVRRLEEQAAVSKALQVGDQSSKPSGTKVVFAETAAERDEAVEEGGEADDGDDSEDDDMEEDDDDDTTHKPLRRDAASRLQRRLATARTRLAALAAAEQELDLQRARMAKTATVDMVTKTGRRIKVRERKR